MKLDRAIKVLEEHNAWRRCNNDIPNSKMQSPTDIGIAIDVLLRAAKEHGTLSMVMNQIASKSRKTKEQRMANSCVMFLENMQ